MFGLGQIRQIAYLTVNLEAAMASWAEKSAIGPFTWFKNLTLNMHYLGQQSQVQMHVGIAWRGEQQIELIQQINEAPSPYRDFFQRGQMGLHHIAYSTDDMDASRARARKAGFEIVATINEAFGQYAYFKDPAMPETLYEFLAVTPDIEAYWQQCIEQASQWDGSDPVTVLDMSAM